jgi:uncharacterized Zn finger protein (UPF0148 family)
MTKAGRATKNGKSASCVVPFIVYCIFVLLSQLLSRFCANRKAVATKVLGVKIMQGYSLLEKQCPHCTMPLTEYKGSIDCFVCPALEKKVAKAKQQRRILESEMSRVNLETQLMEQRKMVQANKNKLLEKTKKLGKPSSVSSSSLVSARHFSNLCDPKINEDRAAESDPLLQEKKTINESNISDNEDVTEMHSTPAYAGALHVITSMSNIMSKASNSTPVENGNDNLKSPDAIGGGNLRIVTSQSNITLKATNSTPAAENTNMNSPVNGDGAKATPTSLTRSKTEESSQSKTIVKAVNTMSTADASSKASNQSKLVVKAQSVLSATTATSSVASHRSKVVVKANSLLSAATVASTQASSRSNVIRIDSLLNKTTMPCSPASAKSSAASAASSKTVVKASSLAGVSTEGATKTIEPSASAQNTTVEASSLAGVPTAASTKGIVPDQATVDNTCSACINGVIEKANETETKSSSVEVPPLVKSEESMPAVSSEVSKSPIPVVEPGNKESGVSISEKKSNGLILGHSASTQLARVTKDSTIAASPEGGPSVGSSKDQSASEGSQSRPRDRGLPIRPVMALVKVTPQPPPAQRKKNKNAITKFAMSTKTTTPQVIRLEESGQPEQKLPSTPHPSEDSSKISSAHSDSTISTKSKTLRSDRHVAVVEHHKEAEAEADAVVEAKMQEKVNLAIGPTDIRSFPSNDSSEKNLSIATPANPGNCISAIFNAAIGTISADDDSIMPPTQHELHKLNLEEIRHLKEAIQAEKAIQENGLEKTIANTEDALIEGSRENVEDDKAKSAAKKERAAGKEDTTKSTANVAECAKACPKLSEEEAHIKPENTDEVVVGPGEEKKRDEVEQDAYAAAPSEPKRKMEKSVESAPATMEDEKSPRSSKNKESTEQSLPDALARAIAEADKTAIAEAESIVRSSAEDYHDNQSRSSSLEEIRRQQWETLRSEGRAAMTRRSMTGWTVSSEFCRGTECGSSPLVVKGSTKQCVVCGGTGTGCDGVYDLSEESETSKKENFASNETTISEAAVIRPPRFDFNTSINLQAVKPPPSSPLNLAIETDTETESKSLLIRPPRISGIMPPDSDSEEGIPVAKLASLNLVKSPRRVAGGPTEVRMLAMTEQPDFIVLDGKEALDNIESKRTIVSKEIGKRMLQGWKLLNLTCPTCLMPLMIDENDEHEICVLCGMVAEGLQSTGTESTMQPTLSFKSTEDNESSLTSPVNFTALVPMKQSETRQNDGIDAVPGDLISGLDSTQKPDEIVTESHKLRQQSPRKSAAESSRKSVKEPSRKSSKKSHKKSSHRSKEISVSKEIGSPRKSKNSTPKSSKEEIDYLVQDLPSIGHLAERIKHRVNTPRSDPPAARGHNVVRKSMLEADAMKAGEVVEELVDVKYTSPGASDDKACGPSPSMVKTFDCDPPKENLASAGVATPFPAHKACDPSPSMKKIRYHAESGMTRHEKKPDASADSERVEPPINIRSPSIDPEASVGEYSEQLGTELINYCESPDYEEILTLEIPKGFDVNDEAALRQLIAQAKVCRPAKFDTADETQSKTLNQDARRGCHLPSPGLTDSPPGSLRVDIDTMMEQHHAEPAMEGRYHHLQSPGMSTASLPLKSPASYRPPRSTTSAAPEPLLIVHTNRSQMRPRITPESMDRTRPSSRSRASSRSGLYSVGEDASESSSFDYVHVYSSHLQSQARTSSSRIPPSSASSSGYRVEKKTPQSPEVIVIGGPDITLMDDLVSLGLKSLAATSNADSISTAALDALLARIEQTKYELDAAGHEQDGVEKHEKIAGLLQELSSAAAQMEMLDDPSSSSSAASCSTSSRGFRGSS